MKRMSIRLLLPALTIVLSFGTVGCGKKETPQGGSQSLVSADLTKDQKPRGASASKPPGAHQPPAATGAPSLNGNTLRVPGRFKVQFPIKAEPSPLLEALQEKKLSGTVYQAYDGPEKAYNAGYFDYSPTSSPSDRKQAFADITDAFTREYAGFEPVAQRKVMMAGQAWNEVTVRAKGDKYTIILRMLDTGATVYFLAAENEKGPPPAEVAQRFFDSFEMLN